MAFWSFLMVNIYLLLVCYNLVGRRMTMWCAVQVLSSGCHISCNLCSGYVLVLQHFCIAYATEVAAIIVQNVLHIVVSYCILSTSYWKSQSSFSYIVGFTIVQWSGYFYSLLRNVSCELLSGYFSLLYICLWPNQYLDFPNSLPLFFNLTWMIFMIWVIPNSLVAEPKDSTSVIAELHWPYSWANYSHIPS